jgi:hypothetical protein
VPSAAALWGLVMTLDSSGWSGGTTPSVKTYGSIKPQSCHCNYLAILMTHESTSFSSILERWVTWGGVGACFPSYKFPIWPWCGEITYL